MGGLARKGTVRVFQLTVDDHVVAMRLGFVYQGGIYLYLFAGDYAWKKHGVLTILMAETFKYAIENGYRFVYLSTGRSHSNLRWRPTPTWVR